MLISEWELGVTSKKKQYICWHYPNWGGPPSLLPYFWQIYFWHIVDHVDLPPSPRIFDKNHKILGFKTLRLFFYICRKPVILDEIYQFGPKIYYFCRLYRHTGSLHKIKVDIFHKWLGIGWTRLSNKSYKMEYFYFWQYVLWSPPSATFFHFFEMGLTSPPPILTMSLDIFFWRYP